MPARASSLDNSVRARARLYCSKNPARAARARRRRTTSQSPPVGVKSEAAMTGTGIIRDRGPQCRLGADL